MIKRKEERTVESIFLSKHQKANNVLRILDNDLETTSKSKLNAILFQHIKYRTPMLIPVKVNVDSMYLYNINFLGPYIRSCFIVQPSKLQ